MKTYLKPAYIFLALILIGGFFFRLKGISTNHSFWSDEAYVALLARDLLEGNRSFGETMNLYNYQRLHLLVTAGSMFLLGTSEFAARLPSVIFGTIGIVFAYLLAKRLSNEEGGILAAFVYAFAQVNLSYATQAKTYAALETLFLVILYLMTYVPEKSNRRIHISIMVLASTATLFHFLGILIWIPYLVYISVQQFKSNKGLPSYRLIGVLLALAVLAFFGLFNGMAILRSFAIGGSLLFSTNNITLFRELIWRHYAFITLPAIAGIGMVLSKRPTWAIALILMLGLYAYLWNFKLLSPRIRYLLPFFGILFTFFGIFWGKVSEAFFPKMKLAVIIALLVIVYAGGYKIVRKPNAYYSPNADLFADVQNADYKTFYQQVQDRYPDLSDIAVFTDWGDTQHWYLPEKIPSAYFRKGAFGTEPQASKIDGVMVYGSLDQFLTEKEKYPRGLLIVEDWESLLPEDIKQYAKTYMKRELRVEGEWPLELYSWGEDEGGTDQ